MRSTTSLRRRTRFAAPVALSLAFATVLGAFSATSARAAEPTTTQVVVTSDLVVGTGTGQYVVVDVTLDDGSTVSDGGGAVSLTIGTTGSYRAFPGKEIAFPLDDFALGEGRYPVIVDYQPSSGSTFLPARAEATLVVRSSEVAGFRIAPVGAAPVAGVLTTLRAVPIDADGHTAFGTYRVTFSSTRAEDMIASTAEFDETGFYSELAGDAEVQASAIVGGARVVSTAIITVAPADLTGISLVRVPTEVQAGQSLTISAVGEDYYGNEITTLPKPLVVTVPDLDPADYSVAGDTVTFFRAGRVEVVGDVDGYSDSSFLDVVAGAPVTIEPRPARLGTPRVGEPTEYVLAVRDAFGNEVAAYRPADQPFVLTSDGAGDVVNGAVVTFGSEGSRVVAATWGAQTGSLAVDVQPAIETGLRVTASSESVAQGGTLRFTVTTVDARGVALRDVTDEAVLSSDTPSDVVDGNTVRFPSASEHVITARLGVLTGETRVTVVPTAAAAPAAGLAATGATLAPAWVAAALLALGVLAWGAPRLRRAAGRARSR